MWRGWAPVWKCFLEGDCLPFIRFVTWSRKGTWVPKSSNDLTRTYLFFNWCGTEIETWSGLESSQRKRKQSTSIKFQRSDATTHRGDDAPRQRETKIQTKKNEFKCGYCPDALQVTNDDKASKIYTMDLQAPRGQKTKKTKIDRNGPTWDRLINTIFLNEILLSRRPRLENLGGKSSAMDWHKVPSLFFWNKQIKLKNLNVSKLRRITS